MITKVTPKNSTMPDGTAQLAAIAGAALRQADHAKKGRAQQRPVFNR